MNSNLIETVRHFTDTKKVILVIGDVMLDRYLIGNVNVKVVPMFLREDIFIVPP